VFHYLRFAVLLLTAMTFSLTALGQTLKATAVITRHTGTAPAAAHTGIAPAVTPAAASCTVDDCEYIPRYANPNDPNGYYIIAITEYEVGTCNYVDHGQWGPAPPVSVNPSMSGMVTGTGTNPIVMNGTFTCNGNQVTMPFAYLSFTWTAHNNQTANAGQGATTWCDNDSCPTAAFTAYWYTMDGLYNSSLNFNVGVPVVRPIGERGS
jgi:hypothetical protein